MFRSRRSDRDSPRRDAAGRDAGVPPVPAHEALEAQISHLRLALDGLPTAVLLVDVQGRVVLRNRRAHSPTGSHHGDALVGDALERQVAIALAAGTGSERVQLLDPGLRVFEVTVSALHDETGGAVATVTDVSERARLDAIRTDFVANISHELKTPVGALTVLAEALAEEDDPDVSRRLSDRVLRESVRLGTIVDDLLELSRIELGEDGPTERLQLADVVAEAASRTALVADRQQVKVTTDMPSGGGTVRGDRRQLVSAVANLIDNALKYSDPGGRVSVTSHHDGDSAVIEVSDQGIGIAPEHLERIFERFYRVDRARSRSTGGTGLGLAIVRHVAINHGGEISVRSEEGVGSTFTLRLASSGTAMSERNDE